MMQFLLNSGLTLTHLAQGPVVQKPNSTNPGVNIFLTHVLFSNLTGKDLSCKFKINKFYPLKIQTLL